MHWSRMEILCQFIVSSMLIMWATLSLIVLNLGILIFVNRAPIIWYSKHQNTVETSTFGSEFVAMWIAVKLIKSL